MNKLSDARELKAISRTKTQESVSQDIKKSQTTSTSQIFKIPKLEMPKIIHQVKPVRNSFSLLFKEHLNNHNIKPMRLNMLRRDVEGNDYFTDRDKSPDSVLDSARGGSRKSARELNQNKQSSTVKIKKASFVSDTIQESSVDMMSEMNECVVGTNRMNDIHKSSSRSTMLDLRKVVSSKDSVSRNLVEVNHAQPTIGSTSSISLIKQRYNSRCLRSVPALCYHAEITPEGNHSLILFFHANGEDLLDVASLCRKLADHLNCCVMSMEYPGYSVYQGAPSEAQILEDSEALMKFIIDIFKMPAHKIFVIGRSIGSGPAIHIASLFNLGGLLLISAFSSIRNVVSDKFGLVISKIIKERFNNLQKIENVSCPIEIVHGELDKLVPTSHATTLAGRPIFRSRKSNCKMQFNNRTGDGP